MAATFRWLCVETRYVWLNSGKYTSSHLQVAVCWNKRDNFTVFITNKQPPSGGCVLKHYDTQYLKCDGGSHLQVAVCWNFSQHFLTPYLLGSHLQVAVCWNWSNTIIMPLTISSHLQVAVCWNDLHIVPERSQSEQPPSGGCVLKLTWL